MRSSFFLGWVAGITRTLEETGFCSGYLTLETLARGPRTRENLGGPLFIFCGGWGGPPVFLFQVDVAPEKAGKEERLAVTYPQLPPSGPSPFPEFLPGPTHSMLSTPENTILPGRLEKRKVWNKISEAECFHNSF